MSLCSEDMFPDGISRLSALEWVHYNIPPFSNWEDSPEEDGNRIGLSVDLSVFQAFLRDF